MSRVEATQMTVDGVGVIAGADTEFRQPSEFPCDDCGAMVDLTSIISVVRVEEDGSETQEWMSEADARALLATMEIPPPPVLCDRHDPMEIATEKWPPSK